MTAHTVVGLIHLLLPLALIVLFIDVLEQHKLAVSARHKKATVEKRAKQPKRISHTVDFRPEAANGALFILGIGVVNLTTPSTRPAAQAFQIPPALS